MLTIEDLRELSEHARQMSRAGEMYKLPVLAIYFEGQHKAYEKIIRLMEQANA